MQLSKNFSLAEMTKSQTAIRMGISNNPSEGEVENLRLLCERVLQPVRDHFNHCYHYPRAIAAQLCQLRSAAASDESALQKEMAADFEIFGTPNNEISDWIKENLDVMTK